MAVTNAAARTIGAHALVGDCRSSALVAAATIDWLCLPRPDSEPIFAAIVGDDVTTGAWGFSIGANATCSPEYRPGTTVLETTLCAGGAEVTIVDAMTIPAGDTQALEPQREVIRVVNGRRGTANVSMFFAPRPDFGRRPVSLRAHGPRAVTASWGGCLLILRAETALHCDFASSTVRATFHISAGERVRFSLACSVCDTAVVPPLGEQLDARLHATRKWWRDWLQCMRPAGQWTHALQRSALTLRLLTYGLSGAVLAAPTTSLPERISGSANWDYRYCWLRDAALVMRSFVGLGFMREARGFLYWLLHATRVGWPRLRVMYDVHGRPSADEHIVPGLPGHAGSPPVRTGNAARDQLQIDVYGHVLSAVAAYAEAGGSLDRGEQRKVLQLAERVCKAWASEDNGIWEMRDRRRPHTFSRMMCWVGLQAVLDLQNAGVLPQRAAQSRSLLATQAAIRQAVSRHAIDHRRHAYTGAFGEDWLDAAILLAGNLGYPDEDGLLEGTLRALQDELGTGALLQRVSTGLLPPEGAFVCCSFWAAEHLARLGRVDEAEANFAAIMAFSSAVGLFGEQLDPATGGALGNYPQAFSHAALISARLAINEASGQHG